MTSVLSGYRQKLQGSSYKAVADVTGYTLSATDDHPESVVYWAAASEAMVKIVNGVVTAVTSTETLTSGTVLRDLGREVVIYRNNAATSGLSAYAKVAVYKQMTKAGAVSNEGAVGQEGSSYWVKVWSETGDVKVVTV